MRIPIADGYSWRISQAWGNDKFWPDKDTGKPTFPYGINSDGTPHMHTGTDFAVPTGTSSVTCHACTIVKKVTNPDLGGGYGCCYWFITDLINGIRYLGIYGHLQENTLTAEIGKHYDENTVIALTDNTGHSTGPHEHLTMIPVEQDLNSHLVYDFGTLGKWGVINWSEKTSGTIDPMKLLQGVSEVLPVDIRYGQEQSIVKETVWGLRYNEKKVKAKVESCGVLYNERIMKAFVYGYWSFEEVMNVGMEVTWTTMSKPAFNKLFNK